MPAPDADGLALGRSWPLSEQAGQFDLGCVLSSLVTDLLNPTEVGTLNVHHAGCWECDLSDNRLTWSGGIYDLFGLPRGVSVSRDEAVAFYDEGSRAAMERLRRHAIVYRRGFTLDVTIRPATGGERMMRLITAPICKDDRVVKLHGLKLAV
jgi:PAS domain-containing protein